MKTVYFIRHAKSSWENAGLSDIERPLNKRGLRDAPFMSKMLKGKDVQAHKLITSPANRAYTTATFFAKELNISEQNILVRKEIYHAYPEQVLNIVRNLDNSDEVVLLFGHNPCFTSLANQFSEEYIPNVPTCGVVKVEADVSSWADFEKKGVVKDFYFPKQYF
ncbi:MAG TPA: histidine phosphatase family protein [Phaeodactylibacter sp.]|nr:histidine phosphatase family protein [Phaeodactylibacter sp.]